MNSSILSVALFALLLSAAHCKPADISLDTAIMMEASPEPVIDPLSPTGPSGPADLYLVQGGRAPYPIDPIKLTPFTKVFFCPNKYGRRGFTVKCATSSSRVFFRINRRAYRTERRTPFFVNGDSRGKIFRFRGLDKVRRLRLGCKVPGARETWVILIKKC